jgi:hypothetical protein
VTPDTDTDLDHHFDDVDHLELDDAAIERRRHEQVKGLLVAPPFDRRVVEFEVVDIVKVMVEVRVRVDNMADWLAWSMYGQPLHEIEHERKEWDRAGRPASRASSAAGTANAGDRLHRRRDGFCRCCCCSSPLLWLPRLTPEDPRAHDFREYVRHWFGGVPFSEIKRDNIRCCCCSSPLLWPRGGS